MWYPEGKSRDFFHATIPSQAVHFLWKSNKQYNKLAHFSEKVFFWTSFSCWRFLIRLWIIHSEGTDVWSHTVSVRGRCVLTVLYNTGLLRRCESVASHSKSTLTMQLWGMTSVWPSKVKVKSNETWYLLYDFLSTIVTLYLECTTSNRLDPLGTLVASC